jgi:hypothetical protein
MNQPSSHDRMTPRSQSDVAGNGTVGLGSSKQNWPKMAAVSLLGAALVGAASYAAGRYDVVGHVVSQFISQPAVAETSEARSAPADTPFLQHARQAGLKACSTVFSTLGSILTNGSQYGVQSSWNTETPDKHAVRALVGMDYATGNYRGPAAGIVFAAPASSACEGTMVRVAPFSVSCANIPSLLPDGSRLTNNLGRVAVYSLGSNQGDALLLPAGETCVVISVASAAQ